MITMYGIKNCDTVKKACKWLDEHGIEYCFHDYKKEGMSREILCRWADELGWEVLVNTRGTTWRRLPEEIRNSIMSRESAIDLMMNSLSVIRRPMIDTGVRRILGFNEEEYKKL